MCKNVALTMHTSYTWFIQDTNTEKILLFKEPHNSGLESHKWMFPEIIIGAGGHKSFEEACNKKVLLGLEKILCFDIPFYDVRRISTLHSPLGKNHFSFVSVNNLDCQKIINTHKVEIEEVEMFTLEETERLEVAYGREKIIPILKDYLSAPFPVKETC